MDIDRNLLELKTRVGDIALVSFQKAATYSQTRVYDILQYIAAQSVPTPRPVPVSTRFLEMHIFFVDKSTK